MKRSDLLLAMTKDNPEYQKLALILYMKIESIYQVLFEIEQVIAKNAQSKDNLDEAFNIVLNSIAKKLRNALES